MKVLSRDFTIKERILLLLLALILIGICYYWFVDQPVRSNIAKANHEREATEKELAGVALQVTEMRDRQHELDEIIASGNISIMGSYNNSKEELRILNDILSRTVKYSINFSDVTRDGDQIRRGFAVTFTAVDYDQVKEILSELAKSEYRCLLDGIQCSAGNNYLRNGTINRQVTVSATATFYETMVGGTPDAGLPADKAAAY